MEGNWLRLALQAEITSIQQQEPASRLLNSGIKLKCLGKKLTCTFFSMLKSFATSNFRSPSLQLNFITTGYCFKQLPTQCPFPFFWWYAASPPQLFKTLRTLVHPSSFCPKVCQNSTVCSPTQSMLKHNGGCDRLQARSSTVNTLVLK